MMPWFAFGAQAYYAFIYNIHMVVLTRHTRMRTNIHRRKHTVSHFFFALYTSLLLRSVFFFACVRDFVNTPELCALFACSLLDCVGECCGRRGSNAHRQPVDTDDKNDSGGGDGDGGGDVDGAL